MNTFAYAHPHESVLEVLKQWKEQREKVKA